MGKALEAKDVSDTVRLALMVLSLGTEEFHERTLLDYQRSGRGILSIGLNGALDLFTPSIGYLSGDKLDGLLVLLNADTRQKLTDALATYNPLVEFVVLVICGNLFDDKAQMGYGIVPNETLSPKVQ